MRSAILFVLLVWLLSPGPAAAAPSLRGGLVINEILVDPNSSIYNVDTDGNGTATSTDEFIEFYNDGSGPLSLAGLEIWRGTGVWFTFPDDSNLPSGAFAVVVTGVGPGGQLPPVVGAGLAFDAGRGTGALANGGDNVVLYDPLADTYLQLFYNNAAVVDPVVDYSGFSPTAGRVGDATDFASDQDGVSLTRGPAGGDTIWRHIDFDGELASPGFAPVGPTSVRLGQTSVRRGLPIAWALPVFLAGLASVGLTPVGRRSAGAAVRQIRSPVRRPLSRRGLFSGRRRGRRG